MKNKFDSIKLESSLEIDLREMRQLAKAKNRCRKENLLEPLKWFVQHSSCFLFHNFGSTLLHKP